MMDKFLTNLAHSRLMTPDFQRTWIIRFYILLAVACVIYLLGAPVFVLTLGALPGAVWFIVSLNVFAYKFGTETILPLMGQMR